MRFGPLDDRRNRYLFEGVVGGISSYGNCLGIPDVGGEVYFSPVYSGNPLVNAMCVGLADADKFTRLAAIAKYPRLLNRPIAVRGPRAVFARPPGKALELLD